MTMTKHAPATAQPFANPEDFMAKFPRYVYRDGKGHVAAHENLHALLRSLGEDV